MIEPRARSGDSDATARELALDPARSILLEAPAGSGKTTVLTRRFLRLLCAVDEPEQVLAITFTRKAAGEMRERIMRALRRDSVGPDAPSAGGTGELAAAVLERSRARGWSLETDPGRLRIQTIDSLNRWLASRLPLAARGAGDTQVMESPEALYRRAARRALLDAESDEHLRGDAERLFARLDNDFGRFERLLTAMLAVRGHWLPVLLGVASDDLPLPRRGAELPARVEESLRAIVRERLESASSIFPDRLILEGACLAEQSARQRSAAEAERAAEAQAGEGPPAGGGEGNGGASDAERAPWRAWLDPPASGEPLALRHWQGLAQLALTAEGAWRRALTQREGFPSGQPELKALKARALEWIADLARIEGARELLSELASLPAPALCEDDAAALASLARLLQLAAGELAIVFAESRRVDFAQVAAAARQALAVEGAPSDLALELGADIRHILVDEFQDTSIEQLRLLETLTAAWEEGDGRTLFVVGDPMQSIYQFREAEVGLFLRAGTHGLGKVRLERLALTRNFRARPALVDWLNEVFPRCFPARDDPRASAVRYRPCSAGSAGGIADGDAPRHSPGAAYPQAAVRLHATPPGEPTSEARAVTELIRGLRAREPAASIAVLVASRAHAAPIAAALEAAGIAVAGVDLVPLGALPAVRDLEALTRALDHLADRTAWLAVLRAPWCGLTLAELSALLEGSPGRTVWEAIQAARVGAPLRPEAHARLARTRSVLARALERRDRLDLASWVESTWLALGGPAACRNDADLDHAQTFLARLAAWSSEPGWPGPLGLAERLEALYAAPDTPAADAVQIMTIHRAKGLEFDKVIVPALGRKLRASAEPLLRWLELPREPSGTDLLMAAIPPPWRRGAEPLSEYLKSLAARRAANERIRLAYVAATRARSELHLFAELPPRGTDGAAVEPAERTLLAALWPGIADRIPALELESDRVGREGAVAVPEQPRLLARLTADWRLPQPAPACGSSGMAVPPEVAVQAEVTGAPAAGASAEIVALPAAEDRIARAVARVICDQLRRCARIGRLPSPGSGALAGVLRERLMRLGLAGDGLEAATRRATVLFESCLEDPKLRWLFSPCHASVESPCRLSGLHDGRLTHVIIDLTFVDAEGVRWLVRFDAGAVGTSHPYSTERERVRLERSRTLARALGSEPVRAVLYDPVARELRERW